MNFFPRILLIKCKGETADLKSKNTSKYKNDLKYFQVDPSTWKYIKAQVQRYGTVYRPYYHKNRDVDGPSGST